MPVARCRFAGDSCGTRSIRYPERPLPLGGFPFPKPPLQTGKPSSERGRLRPAMRSAPFGAGVRSQARRTHRTVHWTVRQANGKAFKGKGPPCVRGAGVLPTQDRCTMPCGDSLKLQDVCLHLRYPAPLRIVGFAVFGISETPQITPAKHRKSLQYAIIAPDGMIGVQGGILS